MIKRVMIRIGHLFFKVRDYVFPVVFFGLAAALRPTLAGGDPRKDLVLDGVGIAIALSGQTLRAVVIGLAYIKRGGKDKKIYADTLVTEGLFAHSRNPLYFGNLLITAGLAVIHNSVWFYAFGLSFFVFAYWCIVLAEEEFLRKQFGEPYLEYCRRVNRFVPSPRGLRQTLHGMSFDWRKVIRKEYGTPFTWITTALALMWWEIAANEGLEAARPRAVVLLSIWGAVAVSYVIARVLKKKGALGVG
jgi:protein-S-isoprenylcysteine O-methyltransferase Ste14